MEFRQTDPQDLPLALLLEADPSQAHIETYLAGSLSFIACDSQGNTLAVAVLNQPEGGTDGTTLELYNIAVDPAGQGQGTGSALLRHVIDAVSAEGYRQLVLGTGTFGYQLRFYQRLGFRVDGVIRDHFLDHYATPIFEAGVQHRDMLRLSLALDSMN